MLQHQLSAIICPGHHFAAEKAAIDAQEPMHRRAPDLVHEALRHAEAERTAVPNSEHDAAAYRAGREAREKGMSRKAIPPEFKSNDTLASAWLEGFDAQGE